MAESIDTKASLMPLDPTGNSSGEPIYVQFNPEKYTFSLNMTWNTENPTQWIKTVPGNLTLTFYFDAYEKKGDVTEISGPIMKKLDPAVSKGKKTVGCLFSWGKQSYKGVITSITEEFYLFYANGTPARSKVTLNLQSWPPQSSS